MATLTTNCATAGAVQAVTLKSLAVSKVQLAEIFFTPTGTYDGSAAESIELTNAASAIQNSRRNGKTATLISACGGQSSLASDGSEYHAKTAVINSTTIDVTLFVVGGSEAADATLPTFAQPMSVVVAFTEA